MISTPFTLPDDPVELKKIIAEMAAVQQHYESENKRLHNRHESLRRQYEVENELLREQIRKLFDQLFGRKSEKLFGGSP